MIHGNSIANDGDDGTPAPAPPSFTHDGRRTAIPGDSTANTGDAGTSFRHDGQRASTPGDSTLSVSDDRDLALDASLAVF